MKPAMMLLYASLVEYKKKGGPCHRHHQGEGETSASHLITTMLTK
jgi:hypothetical protein